MQTIDQYLPEHPFFQGLDASTTELLSGCAMNVHARPGEFLFREGEPADHFYVLRRGRVAIEVRRPPANSGPRDAATPRATSSLSTTRRMRNGSAGQESDMAVAFCSLRASPGSAPAGASVSNARRAGRRHARTGPTGRCYTFAMVTPSPSAARSPDRGAWPWRRCPSFARR